MDIPKYVQRLIDRRARAAEQFCIYDYELSKWLDRHHVVTESCDTRGGVESIVHPWDSAERVVDAIRRR